MIFPQPRGRPRKDSWWDTSTGRWRPLAAPPPQPFAAVPTPQPLQPDPEETARRRIEEEERVRVFEAEAARLRALEEANARAADARRREEERLSAPRRYASSLTGCGRAFVYYFDTRGDFQELGKERERPVRQPPTPPKKRVRVTVDKWVYGPSEKHQLEAGESELVTVSKWVWRDAW